MPISSIYGIFAGLSWEFMEVFRRKKELKRYLSELRSNDNSIGLVPTMGALHLGHISLVKRAVEDNDRVVVTIFVNPTQFDNPNDLEKYPETFDHDLALLQQVSNKIIVFSPSAKEMYDGEIKTGTFSFDGLEGVMEGEFRNNHFNGVATVVKLIFNSIEANRAYFGEKDFQQLQIIKKLVEQEDMGLEIVPCPIEREDNGLARSSRNERLSKSIREKAGFIHEILKTARTKFGTENASFIAEWVEQQFDENGFFELEYFQIADIETLLPLKEKVKDKKYRAFIAVFAEDVRLIDNMALNY